MNGLQQLYRRYERLGVALLVSSAASVFLFGMEWAFYDNFSYWFLTWNLFLAWLPLVFAVWLKLYLRRQSWFSTGGILLTLLWLGFLPNSFYIVSDFIHLPTLSSNNLLYDVVMLASFTWNGFLLGFMSVYLVHSEIMKRTPKESRWIGHGLIGAVLLLCSFAIYVGRYLRWNTWDVLINPAGLIFDVSDRIINPAAHPQTFSTTTTFFVLLASIYAVVWYGAEALRSNSVKR